MTHTSVYLQLVTAPIFLGSGWSKIFPGLEPHLLTLLIQFWIPGHRELGYWFVMQNNKCKNRSTETKPTMKINSVPGLEVVQRQNVGWRVC